MTIKEDTCWNDHGQFNKKLKHLAYINNLFILSFSYLQLIVYGTRHILIYLKVQATRQCGDPDNAGSLWNPK